MDARHVTTVNGQNHKKKSAAAASRRTSGRVADSCRSGAGAFDVDTSWSALNRGLVFPFSQRSTFSRAGFVDNEARALWSIGATLVQ